MKKATERWATFIDRGSLRFYGALAAHTAIVGALLIAAVRF
jgi:hypothetical protein